MRIEALASDKIKQLLNFFSCNGPIRARGIQGRLEEKPA